MTGEHDVTLETEHLEEVIDAPTSGQPVVVIQYRSRGVPWAYVLPLMVLIPLGPIAVYHRVTSRGRRALDRPPVAEQASARVAAPTEAGVSRSAGSGAIGTPPTTDPGLGPMPLTLNSQPIAPVVPAPPSPPPPPPSTPKPDVPAVVKAASPSPSAPAAGPKPGDLAKAARPAEPKASNAATPSPPSPMPPAGPAATVARAETAKPGIPAAPPTRIAARPRMAVGFSAPDDSDNPFAELNIARNPPGTPVPSDTDSAQANVPDGPGPDEPPPTREELLRDIRAEAAEKRAERQQLNNIKDRARDEMEAEAMARTEEDRILFRRELREILKTGNKKAGQDIDNLCDKYGRKYDPDLRKRVTHVLARTSGRMSRDAKVRLLRVYGVPEPGILDFLANDLHRMINSRGGPRDSNEVRINAASQLLGIKLAKDGLQAQRGHPPGATQPGSAAPGNTQAP